MHFPGKSCCTLSPSANIPRKLEANRRSSWKCLFVPFSCFLWFKGGSLKFKYELLAVVGNDNVNTQPILIPGATFRQVLWCQIMMLKALLRIAMRPRGM